MSRYNLFGISFLFYSLTFSFYIYSASYTVVKGDTLYGIARKNSIDVDTLGNVNPQLGMGILIPGQDLIIPRVHKVTSDETVFSISTRYNIDVSDLIRINSIQNGVIKPGQILFLEDWKIETENKKTPITKKSKKIMKLPVQGSYSRKNGIINGFLISSSPGQKIVSPSAGLVVWTDVSSLLGPLVIVAEDDTTLYIYGGNAIFNVNVGDKIKQGSSLGYMEKMSSNPELLFSVYKDGRFRENQPDIE